MPLTLRLTNPKNPREFFYVDPADLGPHKSDPAWLAEAKRAVLAKRKGASLPPARPSAPASRPSAAAPPSRSHKPLPKTWADALDAGYTNDQLRGFITAGVLEDPRELERGRRLVWEGPGVARELEQRGLLGW